jgi:hypothetical protein
VRSDPGAEEAARNDPTATGVTETADESRTRSSTLGRRLPTVLRGASHALVWTMVLVPALIEVADGWRPVRDDAMISIGAYRVFTAQSPLVGAWSQASQGLPHAFFDLGPTLFWLLALPVRIDPDQGALWGAALICGAALSGAVEAAWSVKGWPAAVAAALVVADIGWQTQLFTDLVWNPHFGLAFLIAAAATAWAVACGRFGWWPVAVLCSSVAAQCHLVYAVPGIAVAVIAPLAAFAYRHRPPRRRWAAWGLVVGAVCWIPPLVQQLIDHPGNLSLVLRSGTTGTRVGFSFGVHALATAAAPRPIWLTRYPYLAAFLDGIPHYVSGHASVWAVLAAVLMVAITLGAWSAGRTELSALALIGAVVCVGTVASFASFPSDNLGPLGYLVTMLWVVGTLIWLVVVWACGDLGLTGLRRPPAHRPPDHSRPDHRRPAHRPPDHSRPDHRRPGNDQQPATPITRVLQVAALLLMVTAGVAGLHTLDPATRAQVAAVKADAPLDHAIARSVERTVPAGPVVVTVRPDTFGPRHGDYVVDLWGVALELLQDGWRPGLDTSFFGAATHLSVPAGAHWPEVVVSVDPSTRSVTGARRVAQVTRG